MVSEARSILTQEVSNGRLVFDYELGFVVLHYSPPLACLIVGSWRANQEVWETLYVKDLDRGGPFELTAPGTNAPSLCVWELAPDWHERQAWTRYLYSRRDSCAKQSWVSDCLTGRV